MKKLLPTLLPILGLGITAVAPGVQHFIGGLVSAHPVFASVITVVGLVVNHWIPSPGSVPADVTVARAGMSVLLCGLLVAGTVPLSGCTQSQYEFVDEAVAQLQNAQPILTQVQIVAAAYRELNPKVAGEIEEYAKLANDNVGNLIKIGRDYLARPSADGYQALLNGVDSLVAQTDLQVLAAAKITNPDSQKSVLLSLGLFATGVHIVFAIIMQHAKPNQVRAIPKTAVARVDFERVKPFLSRDYAKEQLTQMGYNADAALARVGM